MVEAVIMFADLSVVSQHCLKSQRAACERSAGAVCAADGREGAWVALWWFALFKREFWLLQLRWLLTWQACRVFNYEMCCWEGSWGGWSVMWHEQCGPCLLRQMHCCAGPLCHPILMCSSVWVRLFFTEQVQQSNNMSCLEGKSNW